MDTLETRIATLEDLAELYLKAPQVRFKRLRSDAVIPKYQTEGAAGIDIVACMDEAVTIHDGAAAMIGTGLAMELPLGFEAQIRPRSGLAARGITVINSPGTIDCDYRGEIKVMLINHGEMATIKPGERIAQIVIARAVQAHIEEVERLSETKRGAGGFGSTGK